MEKWNHTRTHNFSRLKKLTVYKSSIKKKDKKVCTFLFYELQQLQLEERVGLESERIETSGS